MQKGLRSDLAPISTAPPGIAEAVSRADDLPTTLREAGLTYCILTEGDAEQPRRRFPDSGWLDGSVDDLADLIRAVLAAAGRGPGGARAGPGLLSVRSQPSVECRQGTAPRHLDQLAVRLNIRRLQTPYGAKDVGA